MSEPERDPLEELRDIASQPFISAVCEQLIRATFTGRYNFDLSLEAAIDLLCFLITEGWLSPGEKAVTPGYDSYADRAEMARIIGSELPERVEKWWAAHGRAGICNGDPDPLGMREHIKKGHIQMDDLDEEEQRLIEAAAAGPDQARAAAVGLIRYQRRKTGLEPKDD
jgi:hypothetical protein